MTSHNKSLILELLGDISRAGTGNLNPGLREESAGNQHVYDVDGGVDGIKERIGKIQWRRHVVCKTGNGEELRRSFLGLPDTEYSDQKVVAKA